MASGPKAVSCLRRQAGDLRWGGYLQLLLGMRQWDRYKVRRGAKGAGSLFLPSPVEGDKQMWSRGRLRWRPAGSAAGLDPWVPGPKADVMSELQRSGPVGLTPRQQAGDIFKF